MLDTVVSQSTLYLAWMVLNTNFLDASDRVREKLFYRRALESLKDSFYQSQIQSNLCNSNFLGDCGEVNSGIS